MLANYEYILKNCQRLGNSDKCGAAQRHCYRHRQQPEIVAASNLPKVEDTPQCRANTRNHCIDGECDCLRKNIVGVEPGMRIFN